MSASVHENLLATMRHMADLAANHGVTLRMPPRSVETLGTHYIENVPGKVLAAEIPFNEAFTNPTGMMQGGFVCAAFDDVFGPLGYMAAQGPAVSIEISTNFVRPFSPADKLLTVRAEVVSLTRTLLVMEARATNPAGKLIAISKTTCAVLSAEQTSRFRAAE